MSSVMTKVLGDLRRRRLQAAVIALVIFLASGTTTLGLTLLQTSTDPWERAFKAQRGAHLSVLFDRHKVDAEQLAATPGLIGASLAGGPWPWVATSYELGTHRAIGGGGFKFPLITRSSGWWPDAGSRDRARSSSPAHSPTSTTSGSGTACSRWAPSAGRHLSWSERPATSMRPIPSSARSSPG